MKTNKKRGFTIVELLTVMAVIAVLIGLLIPALAQVKEKAKELQQLKQFNAIEVGIELFKGEYGSDPESFDNLGASTPTATAPLADDTANYGGAQKLAEAMVGYDLLGCHPKSGFRSDGQNYFSTAGAYVNVYNTTTGLDTGGTYVEADGTENVDARSGAFVELDRANAYTMEDVYGPGNTSGFNPGNFVLCDVYGKKRPSGEKTGMPILYFRANSNFKYQNYNDTNANYDDIYNYDDNRAMILLKTAESVPVNHEIEITSTASSTAYDNFEKIVLNEQVYAASGIQKPYRESSYILISAGKDGNYGTADDVMNFGLDTATAE